MELSLFIDVRDVRYGGKGDEVGSQERGLRLMLSLSIKSQCVTYTDILPILRLHPTLCQKRMCCKVLELFHPITLRIRQSVWVLYLNFVLLL